MGSQPRHTTDSSGLCTVTIPGILVLVDINKTSVWSSNTPTSASNPAAQLSDSEWEEKQRIFSSRPQPQPARTSFANLDIRAGGSGCSRTFNGNGQDIYIRIRLAASEPDNAKSKVKKTRIIVTSTVLSAGLLILGLALLLRFQKKKHQQDGKPRSDQREDLELPLFDLGTVICATNDFSNHNKVGEGGFGSVYKGTLMDGQEIAVKSLLKHSRQGLNRLKNEVTHIAKLQHWNLVRLLGCCIQEDDADLRVHA
ncbi:G-type lectin S-receptor-like serine/threonine-protein kinase SD1-1 [Malus sylvestris]|uniref:G-type lectin S-receptor-like serine/threonine-protein kinase SD1-1 n=1 Tax=Malus sylvestris TaxID=3752 RepID=UPI0021AD45F6|nr:G-type lectin S-receptor-like serine/threonine-protein kinase SD1-1 [Malus sylvestris]